MDPSERENEDEVLRERLDQEIIGITVKHKISRDEIRRRRHSAEGLVDVPREVERWNVREDHLPR